MLSLSSWFNYFLCSDPKHHLDPMEYFSDVFRRIKTTAKDKRADLLEHRWQPATVGAWFKSIFS